MEEADEEGFDVIFNYGYDYYAFTHNICGCQPEVLDEMSDTLKSLSPEFFINPRCPPGAFLAETASIDVRPGEATNAPKREAPVAVLDTDNSKASEHLSTAEVGPSNEPNSSARIIGEIKADVSGGN